LLTSSFVFNALKAAITALGLSLKVQQAGRTLIRAAFAGHMGLLKGRTVIVPFGIVKFQS
jgi:uncharacterized membrane protein YjjB (DUF3815 family)